VRSFFIDLLPTKKPANRYTSCASFAGFLFRSVAALGNPI
jgi:hypothetical protein